MIKPIYDFEARTYNPNSYLTRILIHGIFKTYMTVPLTIYDFKLRYNMLKQNMYMHDDILTDMHLSSTDDSIYANLKFTYMCYMRWYIVVRHICNQKPPLSIYGSYMQLNCINVSHTFLQRLHICCIYTYMLHICGIYDIFSGYFRPCTQNKV